MDKSQISVEDLKRDLTADLEYIRGIAHQTFNVTVMAEAATRSWYGWPVAIRRALLAEGENRQLRAERDPAWNRIPGLWINRDEYIQLLVADNENQQLRTALTNLVTAVCRESCGHEAPIGKDGYPACNSPCKELAEALELLRPKEASGDDHQG